MGRFEQLVTARISSPFARRLASLMSSCCVAVEPPVSSRIKQIPLGGVVDPMPGPDGSRSSDTPSPTGLTYSHLWPDSGDRSRDAVDAALRAESGKKFGDFPDSLRTPRHPGQQLT